jgi:sigma-B regulation protein RsbU (phosphoserine phosphatase)
MDPVSPSSEHLALLYRLSQTFNSSLDLGEVLNQVMDEVIAATRAERGFVMLVEPDGGLTFHAARGLDHQSIEMPDFQVSRGIIERVASLGQPMLTSDAQVDDRFSMRQSVMLLGLRSVMCAPLQVKGRTIGVIYVDNRLRAGIFQPADLELLSAIASSAAIAIENARLYQLAVEKGRMEQELQMAYRVQSSLLPAEAPQLPGWDFAARWKPARQVAGDYYDFIPHPGGRLGLVIADVTDKGMPAALFMAFTRTVLRASLDGVRSPAEGLEHANRLICAESSFGFFVTLFFAELEPTSGRLRYVNAGHNPPLLLRQTMTRPEPLVRTSLPLGIDPDFPYAQAEATLGPGDLLLLYTDGVTEARDPQGRQFEQERLEASLSGRRGAAGSELLTGIEQDLSAFTTGAIADDDVTLVAVRRLA